MNSPFQSFPKSSLVVSMVLSLTLFFGSCGGKREVVTILGSETMHTMLSVLAGSFNKSQSKIDVQVSGGGSKQGIEGLIAGNVDIAAASRDLNSEETVLLKRQGNLEKLIIGYDGIAIVVHPSNSVSQLHLAQISDIFSGKITNWKQVGGQDAPIVLMIRNDKSGTNTYFDEHVLRQKDLGEEAFEKNKNLGFSKSAQVGKDNYEIADFIEKNPNAISYMGMGSAVIENKGKLKSLGYAKTAKDPFVEPTIKNVHDRLYKLSRALFVMYKPNENSNVEEFITYLTGEEGQKQVLQSGYLRASLEEVKVEATK